MVINITGQALITVIAVVADAFQFPGSFLFIIIEQHGHQLVTDSLSVF